MSLTTTVAFIQNNHDKLIDPAKEIEPEEFVRGAVDTLNKLEEVLKDSDESWSNEKILVSTVEPLLGFNPYDDEELEANSNWVDSDYSQGIYSAMELVLQVAKAESLAYITGCSLEEIMAGTL